MTLLAGRYELAEPLGSGGMARVVAAHDRVLDRRVAVKLVHDDLAADPVSRERLLREARAAAGLAHPHTVAVHDAGEVDGRPFVVMELVEGPTLAERLRTAGRLALAETLTVGVALLGALGAAHERGLVHRDVKPSNVLLPDGGVKLADFGIAKALGTTTAGLTATGRVLGTPSYLAPEQAAGEPATPASDLYALGAVLYECLVGRPPFEAETAIAVALAHQHTPVPPLLERAPDVPPRVAAVVERALAKDPADRFRDAAEMREHLVAAAEGRAMPTAAGQTQNGSPQGGVTQAGSTPAGSTAPGSTAPVPAPPDTTHEMPTDADEGMVTDADEGTDARVPAGRGPRAWLLVAGALALLAVVVVALGLLDSREDDTAADPGEADPGDGATADAEAEGEEPPPEAGDDGAAPGAAGAEDLGELAGAVAADPGAVGERGGDLLEGIQEVREQRGRDQQEDARELIEEIAGWRDEGGLEPAVAERAITLLEEPARPAAGELHEASALFATVARDRPAWGERGGDLLADLDDLLDEDDAEDRAEDATELVDELETWIAEGEIDPDRGRRAIAVLEPLAQRRSQ